MILRVAKEFKYDPIKSYKLANPYCIVFVYSKNDKFVVKGGNNDVMKYINSLHIPMLLCRTFWYKGNSRSIWDLRNCPNFFLSDSRKENIKKYGKPIVIYRVISSSRFVRGKVTTVFKKLRKFPNKWIKELDDFL